MVRRAMPKVTHVMKARKDVILPGQTEPFIKKGESYYWWAFMVGGRGGPKHYSKEPPKPAQLTQSLFMQEIYGIDEDIGKINADENIESSVDSVMERIEELKS